LGKSLTYHRQESLRKKLASRVALFRRLAGSRLVCWSNIVANSHPSPGAFNHRLFSPAWCHSTHTCLIDPAINDALRIVTGCLRPTPEDNLPMLADIQPAELRRNEATLSLARRAMEPGRLIQSALTRPSSADARRLKSRHPFLPTA